jgi:DNA repair exonuclease SbcCD ATPase subunit
MQLSAADRRTVIENILDINIFATMNSVVKSKITETKESIKDFEYEIELTKNQIESQHKLIRLSKESSGIDIEQTKKNLENALSEKQKLVEQFDIESSKESEQSKIIDGLKPKITVIEKQIDQLNYKIESLEEEKSFYETETSCPKCKGKISKETKKENIEKIDQIIYENRQKVSTFAYDLDGLKQTLNSVSIERKSLNIFSQINIANFQVNSYEKDIKRYEDIEKTISSHKGDLDKLNESMVELDHKKTQQKENLEYLSYATDLLKDSGVKSKIIKYYLPTMNKYINKYLSSMNFNIKFTLDEEFNETIKSRYRDDFSYMNFSEGEKMRIDLALLLSWREIAKLKNSVNCNLLILDEVFDSSLDGVGTDDVLRLLNTLGSNANVFVISHKADQISDKFKSTMTFEKKGNFSKLVK